MSYSTLLELTTGAKKIPTHILKKAETIHHQRAKEALDQYVGDQCEKLNNVILENLPSINGLPLSAFLSRMRGYNPLLRGTVQLGKVLEDAMEVLAEPNATSENSLTTYTTHDKANAIRTVCRCAADPNDTEDLAEWLLENAGRFNEAVATSLNTECRVLLQELCVGIAYLTRQFRFRLYDKLEVVIAALVRAMAIALIPWESYVEQYRDAKERHNDLELARGRQFLFHHPRMEYQFSVVNHRVLGYIYYTLGDLLFNCPSPRLIHFFECRIFRRKEITRNLLFTILHVIVINLSEIRSEAEQLANEVTQPSSVSVPTGRSMTPLMSRRGRIYSETLWNELAANLYSDIIRVYNDRNRANKVLINEIMAVLRSHAPDKLPLFEEATLKALEMYTGGGGGRLTETYQIGRPAAGRDVEGATGSGTGPGRRRKSAVIQEVMSSDKITGEFAYRLKTTKLNDTDLTERSLENQSLETRSSNSSDINYSSDSTKREMRISRRTVIVPKIPDLSSTIRSYKK